MKFDQMKEMLEEMERFLMIEEMKRVMKHPMVQRGLIIVGVIFLAIINYICCKS
jgi:hypothetical protein